MQNRLKSELESPHADTGLFREYADTRISLVPDAVQRLGVSIPAQNAGGYAARTPAGNGNGGRAAGTAEASTSFAVPSIATIEAPEGCRFCGGTLPDGRPVTYCPHCGQNLAAKHCAGCGAELDPVWKFCVNCGKKAVL
jgi:membrane protease subunit (stomatin/prohibitin family)